MTGGVASTVHDREAGDASVLPAGSVVRTAYVWAPSARALSAFGDVHAVNGAPSRLQVNVTPALVPVKLKLVAGPVVVRDGRAVIVVWGTTVSMLQVRVAGLASTLPPASVARTCSVCEP